MTTLPCSKKMVIFYILEVLKQYSDSEHRLSQKDIENHLRDDFGISIDRKSIKSNIENLIDFGCSIDYSEKERSIVDNKTGETEKAIVKTDFYLVESFDDSELRLLIDSILFAPHISASQSKKLILKLQSQSSVYFEPRVKHIASMPGNKSDNKQLFYTIEVIDEAICNSRKVAFKYGEYGTDLKMHAKLDANGQPRIYKVSPYQMAAKEGKYYLICNYDKYDDISNYRMDRIMDIQILDEKAKPFKSLSGSNGQQLNLKDYIDEHIFMYSGDSVRAMLRIVKPMISDMVDIFGKDISFSNETNSHVDVLVKANEESILQFAQRYAPDVVIMEPKELSEKVIQRLKGGLDGYGVK